MIAGNEKVIGSGHVEYLFACGAGGFLVHVKLHMPIGPLHRSNVVVASIGKEYEAFAAALDVPAHMAGRVPESIDRADAASSFAFRFNERHFFSERHDLGLNKLGAFCHGPAEKLPAPINSEFREFDAFVSPGEDMIIFSSDRPRGVGRADIYMSRLENGRWSEPMNLGVAVNSEASEYGAMLSPDGRFLFFTSSRTGMEDIYWVSADVLGQSTG